MVRQAHHPDLAGKDSFVSQIEDTWSYLRIEALSFYFGF
jgi:hypothetical protein